MYNLGAPLDPLIAKVERAKKHVLELEAINDSFHKTNPYRIDFKADLQTGRHTYFLGSARPIPLEFSLPLGDAISNLRSCLDHITYALVQVGTASALKPNDIHFPVGGSIAQYRTKLASIAAGLRQDAVKAIGAIEPYAGGSGEYLWHLTRLNNIDKHRLLLTVWGSLEAHTMLPSQRDEIARFSGRQAAEFRRTFIAPRSRVFPLTVGDALLSIPLDDVEENMQFLLKIVFAEPEIVKGNPVIDTLHDTATRIRAIIFDFDSQGLFR